MIALTFRQLQNTVRNGTWCRKRCHLEVIIKHVNDGVFDSKPDLPSFQIKGISFPPSANIIANSGQSFRSPSGPGSGAGGGGDSMLLPLPKLGLTPLSSELAFSLR
jgi:hypothetical protein